MRSWSSAFYTAAAGLSSSALMSSAYRIDRCDWQTQSQDSCVLINYQRRPQIHPHRKCSKDCLKKTACGMLLADYSYLLHVIDLLHSDEMGLADLQQSLDFSSARLVALLLILSPLLYMTYTIIYNLYFSPLSKFPGPKLWACTEFFYQRATVQGVPHQEFLKFFREYGPVVRITPKELIFSSAQAVRDIHSTLHVQKQLGGKREVLGKDERL